MFSIYKLIRRDRYKNQFYIEFSEIQGPFLIWISNVQFLPLSINLSHNPWCGNINAYVCCNVVTQQATALSTKKQRGNKYYGPESWNQRFLSSRLSIEMN